MNKMHLNNSTGRPKGTNRIARVVLPQIYYIPNPYVTYCIMNPYQTKITQIPDTKRMNKRTKYPHSLSIDHEPVKKEISEGNFSSNSPEEINQCEIGQNFQCNISENTSKILSNISIENTDFENKNTFTSPIIQNSLFFKQIPQTFDIVKRGKLPSITYMNGKIELIYE